MFVGVGPDWTTEVFNTKDAWCDAIYVVVKGPCVLAVHGCFERLAVWLAQECNEKTLPGGKQEWAVIALEYQQGEWRKRVLFEAVGGRVFNSRVPAAFPNGKLRDALRSEIERLSKSGG